MKLALPLAALALSLAAAGAQAAPVTLASPVAPDLEADCLSILCNACPPLPPFVCNLPPSVTFAQPLRPALAADSSGVCIGPVCLPPINTCRLLLPC